MACGRGAALTLVTECVDMEAVEAGLQASNSAPHVRSAIGFLNEVDDTCDVVLLLRVSKDTLGLEGRGRSGMGLGLRLVIALLMVKSREVSATIVIAWVLRSGIGGLRWTSRMARWQLLSVSRAAISTRRRAILLSFSSDLSFGGERTSGKEGKNGGKPLHVDLLYDLYDL